MGRGVLFLRALVAWVGGTFLFLLIEDGEITGEALEDLSSNGFGATIFLPLEDLYGDEDAVGSDNVFWTRWDAGFARFWRWTAILEPVDRIASDDGREGFFPLATSDLVLLV